MYCFFSCGFSNSNSKHKFLFISKKDLTRVNRKQKKMEFYKKKIIKRKGKSEKVFCKNLDTWKKVLSWQNGNKKTLN